MIEQFRSYLQFLSVKADSDADVMSQMRGLASPFCTNLEDKITFFDINDPLWKQLPSFQHAGKTYCFYHILKAYAESRPDGAEPEADSPEADSPEEVSHLEEIQEPTAEESN